MRFFASIAVSLALSGAPFVASAQSSPDLVDPVLPAVKASYTPDQLSRLSRRLNPNIDWNTYAKDYLRAREPQRLTSVNHDPKLMEQTLKDVIGELKKDAAAMTSNRLTLDVDGETEVAEVTAKGVTQVKINSPLMEGNFVLDTSHGKTDAYLPSAYILLLGNADLMREHPLQGARGLEIKAALEASDREPAFLRVEFEAITFNQKANVQSVLRKVQWFRDPERTLLVSEKTDERPASTILKKRFLREGITFVAEPDHTLVIDGMYMLELLHQNHTYHACTEGPRERGHIVVECRIPHQVGINSQTVHRYVGGRRAEVRFYSRPNLGMDQAAFSQHLQIEYVQQQASAPEQTFFSGSSQLTTSFKNLNSTKGPYLVVQARDYLALKKGVQAFAVRK